MRFLSPSGIEYRCHTDNCPFPVAGILLNDEDVTARMGSIAKLIGAGGWAVTSPSTMTTTTRILF